MSKTMNETNQEIPMPEILVTMTYPGDGEITGEYVYTTPDGAWHGMRLPGEQRIDEYPAEYCTVWTRK